MIPRRFRGPGLTLRMAVSYVAVSAAAVLVVEVVLIALVAPMMRDASDTVSAANDRVEEANAASAASKAGATALESATGFSRFADKIVKTQPGASDTAVLAALTDVFDKTTSGPGGIRGAPGAAEALVTPGGRVVAVTGATGVRPGDTLTAGTAEPGGATWAGSAVTVSAPGAPGTDRRIGDVLVVIDPMTITKETSKPGPEGDAPAADDPAGGMLVPGLVVLGLLVPVGLVFGMLSTRQLIRRIRRLADGTATMAAGDLRARIPESGDDEITRLERGFNAMAGRLAAAVQAERDAAGAEARRAERTRIARELHDSVSQHLFSLNLLAGGMRRALPPESELRHQAESMERTVDRTMREMRAMLLELRPTTPEDAGLAAAVADLCQAYEARLGLRVTAHLTDLDVAPAVEHAVLRVVQEALRNAARHSAAAAVELSVTVVEGHVVVAVRDDGRGFDPAGAGGRHGLGLDLMRERVTELGGTLDVASEPARGTTVQARIPAGVA